MSATNDEQLKSLLRGLAALLSNHLEGTPAADPPPETVEFPAFIDAKHETTEKIRYRHFNLRLPEQLYAQVEQLKDMLPNTSMQKIIRNATAEAVQRLMKEHGVKMGGE